jgi:hypothetical protein
MLNGRKNATQGIDAQSKREKIQGDGIVAMSMR